MLKICELTEVDLALIFAGDPATWALSMKTLLMERRAWKTVFPAPFDDVVIRANESEFSARKCARIQITINIGSVKDARHARELADELSEELMRRLRLSQRLKVV